MAFSRFEKKREVTRAIVLVVYDSAVLTLLRSPKQNSGIR